MSTVFIISAPSGSGKSTLVKRLMEQDLATKEGRIQFSVSFTTREPRPGEINGEHYHFITKDEFYRLQDADELLEWAEVFGNFYGTSRAILRKAEAEDKDLILDIDVQGASQLKKQLDQAVSIFILPPSKEVLESRLRKRSSDSNAVIERRLEEASNEIKEFGKYDYLLINGRLDASFEQLRGIILAERCRTVRARDHVTKIVEGFAAE